MYTLDIKNAEPHPVLQFPDFTIFFVVLYPRQGRLKAGGEGAAEGEMVRWHH